MAQDLHLLWLPGKQLVCHSFRGTLPRQADPRTKAGAKVKPWTHADSVPGFPSWPRFPSLYPPQTVCFSFTHLKKVKIAAAVQFHFLRLRLVGPTCHLFLLEQRNIMPQMMRKEMVKISNRSFCHLFSFVSSLDSSLFWQKIHLHFFLCGEGRKWTYLLRSGFSAVGCATVELGMCQRRTKVTSLRSLRVFAAEMKNAHVTIKLLVLGCRRQLVHLFQPQTVWTQTSLLQVFPESWEKKILSLYLPSRSFFIANGGPRASFSEQGWAVSGNILNSTKESKLLTAHKTFLKEVEKRITRIFGKNFDAGAASWDRSLIEIENKITRDVFSLKVMMFRLRNFTAECSSAGRPRTHRKFVEDSKNFCTDWTSCQS